jgi:hypothetical protein
LYFAFSRIWWQRRMFTQHRERRMFLALRSCALAAGAAALISSQAAYAAPSLTKPIVDPLVSLSVLGTAQSRTAVCAAGASAAAAGAAVAAAQAAPPGCVLPVTAPPPTPVTQVAPAPLPPAPGPGIGTLPLLLGLAALLGVAAWLILRDDDGDGDLTPISPA